MASKAQMLTYCQWKKKTTKLWVWELPLQGGKPIRECRQLAVPKSAQDLWNPSTRNNSTFDSDLGRCFDHAEGRDGHTGVVGRLHDVVQLQHVPADGHLILFGQLFHTSHPLHVGHRGTYCHACEVHAPSRHHLMVARRDWESRSNTPHWNKEETASRAWNQQRALSWTVGVHKGDSEVLPVYPSGQIKPSAKALHCFIKLCMLCSPSSATGVLLELIMGWLSPFSPHMAFLNCIANVKHSSI